MNRRGILRGAGALLAAGVAKARAAQAPPVAAVSAAQDVLYNGRLGGTPLSGGPPIPDKRYDLFHELMRPAENRRARQRTTAALLGGYPPHLASMHSMAPWMRAQLAAKWAQQQADEFHGINEVIRRQVWGDR